MVPLETAVVQNMRYHMNMSDIIGVIISGSGVLTATCL